MLQRGLLVFLCLAWVLKTGRKGTKMGCMEEAVMDCSFEGLIQPPVEEKSMEGHAKLRAQPVFVIELPLEDC